MRRLTSARLIAMVLASAFIVGCAPGQQLAVVGGMQAAQRAKDAEAQVLKASVCAMSIGAYYRINSELERRALDALCGGLDGALASVDDLTTAREREGAPAAGN